MTNLQIYHNAKFGNDIAISLLNFKWRVSSNMDKRLSIHIIFFFYQNRFIDEFSYIPVKTDGKTQRHKDGVFLWDVEELTFLKIL